MLLPTRLSYRRDKKISPRLIYADLANQCGLASRPRFQNLESVMVGSQADHGVKRTCNGKPFLMRELVWRPIDQIRLLKESGLPSAQIR